MIHNKEKNITIDAYNYIVSQKLLMKLYKLKKDIYLLKCAQKNNIIINYLFSTNLENVNYCINQKFNQIFFNTEFNEKLLIFYYQNKKIEHPLPKNIIKYLKTNKIKINEVKSFFHYFYNTVKFLKNGLLTNFKTLKNILFNFSKSSKIVNYVFFCRSE